MLLRICDFLLTISDKQLHTELAILDAVEQLSVVRGGKCNNAFRPYPVPILFCCRKAVCIQYGIIGAGVDYLYDKPVFMDTG